ncbi:hypothetical protein NRIC_36350 [Enterococcus florum]|uniref:Uncharacterized protein n=1 Tax=Enterococcus florum TaxID=2480627 RepID=A0A4P5PG40_9ENTE|nr:hypothetical protein [Enterococcus florum]GCF95744.1 hypothetical protein NRIC_36350 [Enterococcus florum]
MTFLKENRYYRIAFDFVNNQFLAIDAADENKFAFGITIEQAIDTLVRQ